MDPQRIEAIRKQFHHEWLLIAVAAIDEATQTPRTGHLLAHSADPLEIHKAARQHTQPLLMTVYSDDWPQDLAACFYAEISL